MAEGGGAGSRRASSKSLGGGSGGGARYSRFDADVAAMQRDSSTYCDEPEDEDDFTAWLGGFDLAGRKPDIDRLIAENTFMSELQVRGAACTAIAAATCLARHMGQRVTLAELSKRAEKTPTAEVTTKTVCLALGQGPAQRPRLLSLLA